MLAAKIGILYFIIGLIYSAFNYKKDFGMEEGIGLNIACYILYSIVWLPTVYENITSKKN